MREVTQMLRELAEGRSEAAEQLLPIVRSELRRLASRQLAALAPGETLQPTLLVEEAYKKLVGESAPFADRLQFFAAAARAMRELLIEHARRQSDPARAAEFMRMDDAIVTLEREYPRPAQVVLLRHYLGLSVEETAQLLGETVPTIESQWRLARALLADRLGRLG